MATATTQLHVQVVTTEDRMQAWLKRTRPGDVSADEVVAALNEGHVRLTDDVRERVEAAVLTLNASPPAAADGSGLFLIAQGTPCTEARDGCFEWTPELGAQLARPGEDQQFDYFAAHAIMTVPAGTIIGRLLPPTRGAAGTDVHGRPRPPRRDHGVVLRLGPGVELVEGTDQIRATRTGRVCTQRNELKISEQLKINGDVDLGTGSLDACLDIEVSGTVRSNFRVRTTGNLNVDRLIEAADIEVDGHVFVRGGIFGKRPAGRIRAGGNITARLINETIVDAGGDVHFERELLNSVIRATGRVLGAAGTIIGGSVHAREGLDVAVLGSDAGVTTRIAVGVDLDVLRYVRQLERRMRELEKAAEQIRVAIQPLMANLKRLLPAQRERATELMCQVDEINMQVDALRSEVARRMDGAAPLGTPTIVAREAVHINTQMLIGTREFVISNLIHGPVRFELRKIHDVTEAVVVNQRTGMVLTLPSSEADLDLPPAEPLPEQTKEVVHESDAHT